MCPNFGPFCFRRGREHRRAPRASTIAHRRAHRNPARGRLSGTYGLGFALGRIALITRRPPARHFRPKWSVFLDQQVAAPETTLAATGGSIPRARIVHSMLLPVLNFFLQNMAGQLIIRKENGLGAFSEYSRRGEEGGLGGGHGAAPDASAGTSGPAPCGRQICESLASSVRRKSRSTSTAARTGN